MVTTSPWQRCKGRVVPWERPLLELFPDTFAAALVSARVAIIFISFVYKTSNMSIDMFESNVDSVSTTSSDVATSVRFSSRGIIRFA